ncbi:hypothetical protein T458_06975 [Brevibacillus panacihumi W25]|uniref:Uncharacterized protein n=2 Tax=Brevibacillus panacihumi TaxID=497735 RepID=V6MJS6_9BACL|nr:hypothetical protein T458_06975 [Brevibacillus panacihumi W25]
MCRVLNDVFVSRKFSDHFESKAEGEERMDIGETFVELPRVTSTHSRVTYGNLIQLADNLDFRNPVFAGRAKRNRSVGSAQAFVVELALADREFRERLKRYMIGGGQQFVYTSDYMDRY